MQLLVRGATGAWRQYYNSKKEWSVSSQALWVVRWKTQLTERSVLAKLVMQKLLMLSLILRRLHLMNYLNGFGIFMTQRLLTNKVMTTVRSIGPPFSIILKLNEQPLRSQRSKLKWDNSVQLLQRLPLQARFIKRRINTKTTITTTENSRTAKTSLHPNFRSWASKLDSSINPPSHTLLY